MALLCSDNLPYAYCEQIGKEIRNISDEIPFDIPDSWEWGRLSDLAIKEIKRGKSPVYADSGSVLVFAQKCNVKTGGINITLAKYLSDSVISKYPQEEYVQDEDIIVNSTGTGTLGRIGVYSDKDNPDNIPLVPDSHVTIVRVNADLSQYIYYILKWYQPYLEECGEGSTKQKELKPDRIKELFIPIPPVSEQHRIVSKIKELLPYIDKYGKAEEHLTALNTTFPEALKKSILQEAVQGKLVPQNPDDEPASVLLERIRAEKQALIKAGKIKKDKHESVIITRDKIPYEIIDGKERCIADEVPFELPDSWCWERLGNIFQIIRGSSPRPKGSPLYWAENAQNNWITIKDISLYTENGVLKQTHEHLTDLGATKSTFVEKGEIVIAVSGSTTGKFCVLGIDGYIYDGLAAILNPTKIITADYMVVFFNWIYQRLNSQKIGSAFPNINTDVLKNTLIPLPPINEQKLIVSKTEELMQYCNKL